MVQPVMQMQEKTGYSVLNFPIDLVDICIGALQGQGTPKSAVRTSLARRTSLQLSGCCYKSLKRYRRGGGVRIWCLRASEDVNPAQRLLQHALYFSLFLLSFLTDNAYFSHQY